jgi:hypothetical protein
VPFLLRPMHPVVFGLLAKIQNISYLMEQSSFEFAYVFEAQPILWFQVAQKTKNLFNNKKHWF